MDGCEVITIGRAQETIPQGTLVVRATGVPSVDTGNLTVAFQQAAALDYVCVLVGEFYIEISETPWFNVSQEPPTPIYGGVPLVSNLQVDARSASFRFTRGSWMGVDTRSAMFYSPGFSTDRYRFTNIRWRGGLFNFVRTDYGVPPQFSYAFGLLGVDDFELHEVDFIGNDPFTLKRGRVALMLNCTKPRILQCEINDLTQGLYFGWVDNGIIEGLRASNMTEVIDFDRGVNVDWTITDIHVTDISEQLLDGCSLQKAVIKGIIATRVDNIVQLYPKGSSWPTYKDAYDNGLTMSCAFDMSADTCTFADLGTQDISDGSRVSFTGDLLPTGLVTDFMYYIVNSASPTVQVATTEGGSPIDISGSYLNVQARIQPRFRPPVSGVLIEGVQATECGLGHPIAQVSLPYGTATFYIQGQIQCENVTFRDWTVQGGTAIVVHEGTNIKLLNLTLLDPSPSTTNADTAAAIVFRQAVGSLSDIADRNISGTIQGCHVSNSSSGGYLVVMPSRLFWQDNSVEGYSGGDVAPRGVFFSRMGAKAGSVLYIGQTNIGGGTDNCTDFTYSVSTSPIGTASVTFAGPFNFYSANTATGVTPTSINIGTTEGRASIRGKLPICFNEPFSTVGPLTQSKFAFKDEQLYFQIFAASVGTQAAITGSNSNNSQARLINYTAGVGTNVANGFLIIDPASVAADAERNMSIGVNEVGSLVAPGSTLMVQTAARTGSGSSAPPYMVNIAGLAYTMIGPTP